MSDHEPEAYQKQDEQPLYGFNNYARWRDKRAKRLSPSDIDAWQHARVGDRHLFLEFKAAREHARKVDGQLEGLLSLSRRPGMQVLVVFDPFHKDCSTDRMPEDMPLRARLLRGGLDKNVRNLTVGKMGAAVFDWQWNKGPLAQPIVDAPTLIARLIAEGKTPEEIALALGHIPST